MYCVRLVLLDAADPGGEPRSRRLQAAATDGHYLRCAADVGARSDHARCRVGAGAGNRRRIGDGRCIGAAGAGREESQAPSKSTAPAARAARAPATAGTAGELRLPAVVRGLSAHVLKTGKLPQNRAAGTRSSSRGGIAAARGQTAALIRDGAKELTVAELRRAAAAEG